MLLNVHNPVESGLQSGRQICRSRLEVKVILVCEACSGSERCFSMAVITVTRLGLDAVITVAIAIGKYPFIGKMGYF